MELRHLRYFVVVAEELNFNRAARRLYISQPPLSQQIRALEVELGHDLFAREKKRVSLTEFGKAYLAQARELLAHAERVTAFSQEYARQMTGELRIGITEIAMMEDCTTEILKRFRQQRPNVRLILRDDWTEPLVRGLLNNDLDVAFLHPPLAQLGISLQPINASPLVLVLPADHPLADREPIRMADLAGESFFIHPRVEGPVLYDAFIALCMSAGFSPWIVQETIPQRVSICFVGAGQGVTLVTENMRLFRHPGVVYRSIAEPVPSVQLGLAWRSNRVTPLVELFREIVKDVVGNRS